MMGVRVSEGFPRSQCFPNIQMHCSVSFFQISLTGFGWGGLGMTSGLHGCFPSSYADPQTPHALLLYLFLCHWDWLQNMFQDWLRRFPWGSVLLLRECSRGWRAHSGILGQGFMTRLSSRQWSLLRLSCRPSLLGLCFAFCPDHWDVLRVICWSLGRDCSGLQRVKEPPCNFLLCLVLRRALGCVLQRLYLLLSLFPPL